MEAVVKRSTSYPLDGMSRAVPPVKKEDTKKIRLLIASEHPIMRTALGKLLNGIPGFEVAREVDLSKVTEAARELSPHVFLIELTEAIIPGLRSVTALMRAV